MSAEIFKYCVLILYVGLTFFLSWVGMKRTSDLRGFSVGNKDMSPYLVGITLAASISSTATFVINPGFVYVHGLSAFLHFGVAASLGILTAFIVLSKGFYRLGDKNGAITIPSWIYHRYGNRSFSFFFAIINLLSITFVVLILVGCSLLLSGIFPVSQKVALILVLLFVFSYVLMGGTYAHAYTNTMQGIMMMIITLLLVVHGVKYLDAGFLNSLNRVGENYASIFNKQSELYYDLFSVFGSGFIVTFALMLQPHILTKVLYLKNEGEINKFIITTAIVGFIFSLMLMIGFYARLSGVETVSVSQDSVLIQYLISEFTNKPVGEYILVFIFITLLAAGMSTLDGILVSLSAMVVNDIYMPVSGENNKSRALLISRVVLVIVGVLAAVIAWNPPQLVGLFAQKGVYGLAAASVVPVLFGVLVRDKFPYWIVYVAALNGLLMHLVLNLLFGVKNPAVSASYAILVSMIFALLCIRLFRLGWLPKQLCKVP